MLIDMPLHVFVREVGIDSEAEKLGQEELIPFMVDGQHIGRFDLPEKGDIEVRVGAVRSEGAQAEYARLAHPGISPQDAEDQADPSFE